MEPSPSDSNQPAKNARAQVPTKRDMAKQKVSGVPLNLITSSRSVQRRVDAGAVADQDGAAAVKTATEYCRDAPLDVAALMGQPFAWPPTKEEDKIADSVLYGPSRRRRLPVFKEICPD